MTISNPDRLDIFTICEVSSDMLGTVEDVIEALGGTASAASLLGVSSPAVSNWKERGKIAPDKFLLVREALSARGIDVDPRVFAFKSVAEAR